MKKITQILPVAAIALATVSAVPAQAQQVEEFSIPAATQSPIEQSSSGNSITIAQGRERFPETSATEKYSYVGVGANIGLSDKDRSVADGGRAVHRNPGRRGRDRH